MTRCYTLIYPQNHEAGRAQSRAPDPTVGGPVPNGPRSQAQASSGPCPASSTTLPLEEDPRPSRCGSRKVTQISQISGFTQDQNHSTYLNIFQFFRIELRWEVYPDGGLISFRLTLGLRKLIQASQFLQRARIRENACPPRLWQAFQAARSGAHHPTPPWRGRFVCGLRAPWPTAQGG